MNYVSVHQLRVGDRFQLYMPIGRGAGVHLLGLVCRGVVKMQDGNVIQYATEEGALLGSIFVADRQLHTLIRYEERDDE